jgi:cobyrinic acid a,c-diamide synthase
MYVCRELVNASGQSYPMLDLLPARTVMQSRRAALGYISLKTSRESPLGPPGTVARGHEFHYSEILEGAPGQVYSLRDSRGKDLPAEGFRYKNTLASYVHVHFGSNPHIAEQFATFIMGERIA